MIDKSGYTLREISKKCSEYGVKVVPSYISKLQTGKQPPASDEINIAIAKACGEHPGELLYEGYMVKAPDLIKHFVQSTLDYFRENEKKKLRLLLKESSGFFEELTDNQNDYLFLRQLLEGELLYTEINGVDKYEKVNQHSVHSDNLEINSFVAKVPDNALDPIIPEGVLIEVESTKQISNGDFVVAMLHGGEIVFRRYFNIDSQEILVAENKNFEPIKIEDGKITIIGRIKSFTTKV